MACFRGCLDLKYGLWHVQRIVWIKNMDCLKTYLGTGFYGSLRPCLGPVEGAVWDLFKGPFEAILWVVLWAYLPHLALRVKGVIIGFLW